MTRMFCAALLVLAGFASLARAADAPSMPAPSESAPPPGMPAPTEATPPAPGAAGPVVPAGELAEEAPPQRAANLSYGVGALLRWVSVPGFMLDLFTKRNVPLSSWGTGLQFFRRKGNFDLVGSLTYQDLSPLAGQLAGRGPRGQPRYRLRRVRSPAAVGRRRLVHLAHDVHRVVRHALRRRHRSRPGSGATSCVPATGRSAPRRTPATSASAIRRTCRTRSLRCPGPASRTPRRCRTSSWTGTSRRCCRS